MKVDSRGCRQKIDEYKGFNESSFESVMKDQRNDELTSHCP